MILEVMDQGRFEKLAVADGSAGKDIDGRAYIGGATASAPADTNRYGSTSPSGTLRHCPSRTEFSHIASPGRRTDGRETGDREANRRPATIVESPLHIRFGREEES